MPGKKSRLLAALAAGGGLAAALLSSGPAHAATTGTGGYTASPFSTVVEVGPAGTTPCKIVGELFVPNDASREHRVPAILTTNGFGGSYSDQVPLAQYFASRDYVVLAYSGLGFGGSGCNIELDNPAWDGKAASELVSWLGHQPEILKDGPDDPRVGMIGESYGGAVQFSAAAIDHRIDAIVPIITWNDLAYSLAPNNNAPNFVHSDSPPGVVKYQWASFFFADGVAQPAMHPFSTPVPPSSCPGFAPSICKALVTTYTLGYPDKATVTMLRSDSMVSFWRQVRAPTLLMQGEDDTLFNINEAVANYMELRDNHVPVKLVLQSWGHSDGTPAPGEVDWSDPAKGYEVQLITDWFAKYLEHRDVNTGPAVEYWRSWVPTPPGQSAEVSYGTSTSWPVGTTETLDLTGAGTLVSAGQPVPPGTLRFLNPPGGEGGSYSEVSEAQSSLPDLPPSDLPGTYAAFVSAPLSSSLDSVGIPTVTFTLRSALPPGSPETDPVLFGKIYDLSPGGKATLVDRLVSPIRVGDLSRPVTITLPGVVHRYEAGDRLELVLAATDDAYVGSRPPNLLSIVIDASHPAVLRLPVVQPSEENQGTRATPVG